MAPSRAGPITRDPGTFDEAPLREADVSATADLFLDADLDAEALARRRWRHLVHDALPSAAVSRPDWPIRRDHCFARVILDTVYGRPWREVLAPPAWRHMESPALGLAIALAESVLDGSADLRNLDAASLAMRGKRAR